MCEHEFVFGRINATHCKRCNDTEQEVILAEQLAAANARVAELEQDLILQGRIINGQSEIAKQFEQQLAAAKARMKRMEDALKMARPALVRADSDTSYIAHRYSHVLTAAKCPLTEAELLKTSGMCISAENAVKAALEEKP